MRATGRHACKEAYVLLRTVLYCTARSNSRACQANKCPECTKDYCIAHRAPGQHGCTEPRAQHGGKARAPPHTAAPRQSTETRTKTYLPVHVEPARAAALQKPDRRTRERAARERASAIRAMQERYHRGLLNPAEQVLLAELMAGEAHTPPPRSCTVC